MAALADAFGVLPTEEQEFRLDFPDLFQLEAIVNDLRASNSLDGVVLENRYKKLRVLVSKIISQRAFIREERRHLRKKAAILQDDKLRQRATERPRWFPASFFPNPSVRRIKLSVGGQIFELSSTLASKDENSLLAALAAADSPLLSESHDGIFTVERDWWLFRHILSFLRDGCLPDDEDLLRQLYIEADFWRMQSLQRAIEERHLRIFRRDILVSDSGAVNVRPMTEGFWNNPPEWMEAVAVLSERTGESEAAKEEIKIGPKEPKDLKKKYDWWTAASSEIIQK